MKPRIIVALDFSSLKPAQQLIEMLAPEGAIFKVGKELCTVAGVPAVVDMIHRYGGDVFLDLKYHDIPNTVASAVAAASEMGVWMVNMHVSAGPRAMEAAVKRKGKSTKLIGVTILTSMDDVECRMIYQESTRTMTGNFMQLAWDAGLDGVVCSAHELDIIRQLPSRDKPFTPVVPGIRPKWAETGDQSRITTPAQALRQGAQFLVIGRPITRPPDQFNGPLEAYRAIVEEINA